jgi:polysaccharidase protein
MAMPPLVRSALYRAAKVARGLLWAWLAAASAEVRAATYYVDSETGSDQASGHEQDQAWRTIGRVNAMQLKPGDAVLFRRGRVWNGQLQITSSGRPDAPIVFGSFGDGARPVLERGAYGIVSENQRHIEIRDLHIRDTPQSGISVKLGTGWRIHDVTIERTGNPRNGAGIAWWHGSDLTIANSRLKQVTGDGIWAWQADGLRLLNNYVSVVQGPNGDNAHIQHAKHFEIRGNVFSMEGPTDSGKGNMLLGPSENGVIANNTFIAGNYGIGIDASDTLVESNHFIDHDHASWSAALNMGAGRSRNLTIRNNYFDGARVGLSLFELTGQWADAPVVRANMMVVDNIFSVRQYALAVDGPVQYSGGFIGNTIIGVPARDWNRPGGRVASGGWNESAVKFVKAPPPWSGGSPCSPRSGQGRGANIGSAKPTSPAARSGEPSGATASCPGL